MHNYSGLEQELVDAKIDLGNELISTDIDDYIREGIRKGREQRARTKIRMRRRLGSSAAALLLILSCLLTVRISPVFASFMRDIPGMATFVDLIQNSPDRGLQLALDNDFVQQIGIADENGGIKFTVEGIIVDEARALIFYSIENKNGDELITLSSPRVSDLSGKALIATISWGNPNELDIKYKKNEKNISRGTIDVQLQDGLILPDQIVLKSKLGYSDQEFKVNIPIDHAKFAGMTKEYILNKTIEVEGQRVAFVKATVNPLRVSVELSYDESNSKQVFGPIDLHLIDEKGEIWKYMGRSGQNILYFESNYFHYPKELYLEGEYFRALDQNKRDVIIDTQAGKLIKAPDASLSLIAVDSAPGVRLQEMTLSLHLDHDKDDRGYNMMLDKRFTDAIGGVHYMVDGPGGRVWSSSGDLSIQEIYYFFNNKDYPQPLTFHVNEYPSYIQQTYKIKVK
ncbi:DUF4179 domain-containing protein [Paenibacillus psychroresistens]|uniref:DUF4179 domain-containing protein n=1 Tax=Paenibacillus psychroresistens TaxID=1778678 RepID=A0A6B8RQB7_9BACL|nr:DUF4179 domain-containing protein [Paenibacillus psychroresistens]QGQ97994.1 DUF4179 domain-containing protein [Paenibacillus psychroresistens]